jgi:hypothetical protein
MNFCAEGVDETMTEGQKNTELYHPCALLTILLELENVLVELLLQRLVGVVDGDLLKVIALKRS